MTSVLLDTGPLVALVDGRDTYHRWSVAHLERMTSPLLSCESVLAEACHLLRRVPGGSHRVLDFIERGALKIAFHLADENAAVRKLVRKYADVPMSLADACLVRMTEMHTDSVVFTLDSDFHRYRRNRRQVIPLIIPNR